MNIANIQAALLREGFDPGPIDGIWGRLSTAAMRAYQRSKGFLANGIPSAESLAALWVTESSKVAPDPLWLIEARRRMGLHEVRDKSVLWAWLKSDGRQLGDPSKLPWCGDFVDTAIARTLPDEPMLANPYWAQNWANFGVRLERAAVGAILVFKRPGGGHVGFCVGEDATHYSVLGGNQSNAVTIARIEKSRCIAVRWPATAPLPTDFRLAKASGAVSKNEA